MARAAFLLDELMLRVGLNGRAFIPLLLTFPSSAKSIRESYAGILGSWLEPLLAPIGFNLEIAIALVPGFAAREVAVGALGTVYAVQSEGDVTGLAQALQTAGRCRLRLLFLLGTCSRRSAWRRSPSRAAR